MIERHAIVESRQPSDYVYTYDERVATSPPPTPRLRAARSLAEAVVEALEGGDLIAARAAAAALHEFTARLVIAERDSAVGDVERKRA